MSTSRGSSWSVCLQMCWQRLWGSGWDKTINMWPTLRCGQWLLIRHGSCIGVSVTSSLGDGMMKATLAATCFPPAPSRTIPGVRSAGDHCRKRSLPWRWQLFEITLTVTGHCLLCDAIQHFTMCCGSPRHAISGGLTACGAQRERWGRRVVHAPQQQQHRHNDSHGLGEVSSGEVAVLAVK